jgi:hypothetical protein
VASRLFAFAGTKSGICPASCGDGEILHPPPRNATSSAVLSSSVQALAMNHVRPPVVESLVPPAARILPPPRPPSPSPAARILPVKALPVTISLEGDPARCRLRKLLLLILLPMRLQPDVRIPTRSYSLSASCVPWTRAWYQVQEDRPPGQHGQGRADVDLEQSRQRHHLSRGVGYLIALWWRGIGRFLRFLLSG